MKVTTFFFLYRLKICMRFKTEEILFRKSVVNSETFKNFYAETYNFFLRIDLEITQFLHTKNACIFIDEGILGY